MKLFLLIAGHHYYPSAGTSDWIGCFNTEEEALSRIKHVVNPRATYSRGPRKGQIKDKYKNVPPNTSVVVTSSDGVEHKYDWFEIVNLGSNK
jgi:hypothetical protein